MSRQLADRFVKDPHEVVKAGDVVKVRVVEVDVKRKRIGLTMRKDGATAQPASARAPADIKGKIQRWPPSRQRTTRPRTAGGAGRVGGRFGRGDAAQVSAVQATSKQARWLLSRAAAGCRKQSQRKSTSTAAEAIQIGPSMKIAIAP